MDIESDGSERWEDFFGSSTDLAPSLLGYYDSLAIKVTASSDGEINGNEPSTPGELIEPLQKPSETAGNPKPESNGNCDDHEIPKLSFIQQRIKSLTSALVGDEDIPPDPEPDIVLRNPEKAQQMAAPAPSQQNPNVGDQNDAFVENCDDSEHRTTIVEARNPYLNLVVVEPPESGESNPLDPTEEHRRKLSYARAQLMNSQPHRLTGSPKFPRSPHGNLLLTPSTSTSTPSLDTVSSNSLSSSKTSLTQTPGTPVLNTRPLSATSICSYSSSSSSGSDNLLLAGGRVCGASYQASVESLADPSECEQNGGGTGLNGSVTTVSGLTMCERAVNEIIDSERSYVEDLGQIIKGYLQDWKERACLKVDELDILFSNIQEIWEFNTKLLSRLNESGGDPVKISDCFVDLHGEFNCYTTYCTRYPEAIALLTRLLQATYTNSLLINTQKMLNHTLPLGSYLLKPVQRILKYHLLLDNLRKHYDDQQVAHAHDLMKNVAHSIDQVKKKLEQQSRVKELSGILDGWLGPDLSVLGELKQEGLLSEHTKPRVVLLFETMLIITKPKEDKRLQFRAYIPCKNLMLVEHLPGEPASFNVIPYNDPKGQIKLTARTRDQKRHWTQLIKHAMLEHFDIPKRAKELVLKLGDDDDRITDKNGTGSWKWPTNHPTTPEYLERRQQFRRSEMRMRSKKMRKNTASSISLDGISQKDIRQPTFQSYSNLEADSGKETKDRNGCKCETVKKELEQVQQTKNRSRSETRLEDGRRMSEEMAKADRNRFKTQGRRSSGSKSGKESLSEVKSYDSMTIPKRISNIRKTRSKTLTGNSTFYTDLGLDNDRSTEDNTVLKITESTDNLSLVESKVESEIIDKVDAAKLKKDSEIISQLILEKNEFKKSNKPLKKKSFDSMRSLSCQSQDEDGYSRKDEPLACPVERIPTPPSTEPPLEDEDEAFRKVEELNKNSEDMLSQLNEIQNDLPTPEPIYESLLRNVHVPYKYVPPLTRSVSQQYGKAADPLRMNCTPKKSRPESDYVTLAYSENVLVNIDGHSVTPKSAIAQLRNSDTNINYHHQFWRKDDDHNNCSVHETRSEIVNLANGEEQPKLHLERHGSLSMKSPKNLLQRFISLHASPSTGSCDSNLHQRKTSFGSDEKPAAIYKQGSLDLGSRIANLDYADPRTLFPQPNSNSNPTNPNILINRGAVKSTSIDSTEQRDSIFSSSDSVCGTYPAELDDESYCYYEKSVEECLENDDFRDSAVYSGDDNDRRLGELDSCEQLVYTSIGEMSKFLKPPTSVVRSSSSASSSCSTSGVCHPPIPAKPAHLEHRKVNVLIRSRPASSGTNLPAHEATKNQEDEPRISQPKGWVLQQVKRFQ
ncbi:uncharacterized protein LOC129750738 isoform X2 [Uranotaenia lowii]|uniref:uncharacterized protein LOC129750738 isoform X2 n=1 Tax=Uranotaenia lowii TaxID=190385 RepID=UPI002479790B|nr:uncharacterized protein LOC129750738 isoform X2 [Uranotaenia lowii]